MVPLLQKNVSRTKHLREVGTVEEIGDKNRLAEYYFKMGFYYSVMGNLEDAIQYCTRSIELARLTTNERIIDLAYVRQGYNYLYKGEFKKVIPIVEKGIKILERLGGNGL